MLGNDTLSKGKLDYHNVKKKRDIKSVIGIVYDQ